MTFIPHLTVWPSSHSLIPLVWPLVLLTLDHCDLSCCYDLYMSFCLVATVYLNSIVLKIIFPTCRPHPAPTRPGHPSISPSHVATLSTSSSSSTLSTSVPLTPSRPPSTISLIPSLVAFHPSTAVPPPLPPALHRPGLHPRPRHEVVVDLLLHGNVERLAPVHPGGLDLPAKELESQ